MDWKVPPTLSRRTGVPSSSVESKTIAGPNMVRHHTLTPRQRKRARNAAQTTSETTVPTTSTFTSMGMGTGTSRRIITSRKPAGRDCE